MTALVNSFARIWLAKDRFPHRTWWGTPGSRTAAVNEKTPAQWAHEKVLQFTELTQRTVPAVVAIALNILR